jgi:hypothetical protein
MSREGERYPTQNLADRDAGFAESLRRTAGPSWGETASVLSVAGGTGAF